MNFQEARNIFENSRKRKIDNNTYLTKTEEGYGLRLHNTVVVEFLKDRVRLNTGGWRTITTKDRMNFGSPLRVFQKKNLWYLGTEENPYFDGIEVSYRGRILNSKKNKNEKIVKQQESMLKKIDSYVKGFMKEIKEGTLPSPSAGDCWCCAMKAQEGRSLGDSTGDSLHLINHMKEKYYVPSLLVNAIKEKGYNPSFVNPWNGFGEREETFKKALKDYLKKRLLKGEA